MIITLTGNLLAERTFEYARWTAGKTQRAVRESFQVGGKGINVSKMLHRLQHPTTAWCFAGGASGEECVAWLEQNQLPCQIFQTTQPTRSGVVVRAADQPETTFLGPDRPPDAAALLACRDAIERLFDADEPGTISPLMALCGSFPGWSSPSADPLRDALSRVAAQGRLVVDSYGAPLRWAVEQPVSLVKVNRQEFDDLFDEQERTSDVLQRLGRALMRWPVRAWIITDGADAVCYADSTTRPTAVTPPRVTEVSATGSGDVFLACVLHAIRARQSTLAQAIKYALPYAAANAAHPGVAEFDLNLLPA